MELVILDNEKLQQYLSKKKITIFNYLKISYLKFPWVRKVILINNVN
jgi:hypothetical protein